MRKSWPIDSRTQEAWRRLNAGLVFGRIQPHSQLEEQEYLVEDSAIKINLDSQYFSSTCNKKISLRDKHGRTKNKPQKNDFPLLYVN